MKLQDKVVKRNPTTMWKDQKEIFIVVGRAGKQRFICCYDDRKEKYFYSPEANHSYHSRLFNRMMDVVVEEKVYTKDEMRDIAINKYIKAHNQMQQSVEVLNSIQNPISVKKTHSLEASDDS